MKYCIFLLSHCYFLSLSAQHATDEWVGNSANYPLHHPTENNYSRTDAFSLDAQLNDTLRITEGFHQPFLKVVSVYSSNKQAVKIYPNPSYEYIYIETGQTVTVSLFSADGEVSLDIPHQNNFFPLNISALSSGIYFLTIKNKKGKTIDIRKIVKYN